MGCNGRQCKLRAASLLVTELTNRVDLICTDLFASKLLAYIGFFSEEIALDEPLEPVVLCVYRRSVGADCHVKISTKQLGRENALARRTFMHAVQLWPLRCPPIDTSYSG